MSAQEDSFVERLKSDLAEHAEIWTQNRTRNTVIEARPPPRDVCKCAALPLHLCAVLPAMQSGKWLHRGHGIMVMRAARLPVL
jgi:hypothetical protein